MSQSQIPLLLGSASKPKYGTTPASAAKAKAKTPSQASSGACKTVKFSTPQPQKGPRPPPPLPPQHNFGPSQTYQRAVIAQEQQRERDEKANFSVSQRQWLNLLLTAANQSLPKLGLTRPMVLKDLDTLTPELLKRLLILLLTAAGEFEEKEFAPTIEFLDPDRTLKIFNNVLVDTTVFNLYWKVKHVFPENDNMFDYSILYYPAKDPKRTKAVLKYLMAYLCFTESIYEKFENTLAECLGIIKEQQEGLAAIEALKTKLNAKIVQVEEWKAEMPMVQAKDMESIRELESIQATLPPLEEKISNQKRVYNRIEMENANLESKLASMNIKIEDLESKRVYNAETTLQKHEDEKTLLNRAVKAREDLTAKREKLAEDENFVSNVVEEAKELISGLEEFTVQMQETVELAEKAIKSEHDHRIKKQKLEDLWLKVKKNGAQKDRLKTKFAETQKNLIKEKQRGITRLENMRREVEDRRVKAEADAADLRKLIDVETKMLANIHKIQKEIAKVKEYLDVTVPNRWEELMAKTKTALEECTIPLELKVQRFNSTYKKD